MGFFNILETFFFISLAITFVLIIMLVYHFKARLTNVENKYDTMFGIMHNMVGELKGIKKDLAMSLCGATLSAGAPFMCMRQQPFANDATDAAADSTNSSDDGDVDEDDNVSENSEEIAPSMPENYTSPYSVVNGYDQSFIKIIVSDNEELPPLESDAIEVLNDSEKIADENLEDISFEIESTQENQPQTKVITLELSDNLEEMQMEPHEEDAASLAHAPTHAPTHIVINKIDESADAENELSDLVKKHDLVDYKKMDVSYLRTLVITRGLATDTKKLKKLELISLLEESDA
jgi:hypothetical protein